MPPVASRLRVSPDVSVTPGVKLAESGMVLMVEIVTVAMVISSTASGYGAQPARANAEAEQSFPASRRSVIRTRSVSEQGRAARGVGKIAWYPLLYPPPLAGEGRAAAGAFAHPAGCQNKKSLTKNCAWSVPLTVRMSAPLSVITQLPPTSAMKLCRVADKLSFPPLV